MIITEKLIYTHPSPSLSHTSNAENTESVVRASNKKCAHLVRTKNKQSLLKHRRRRRTHRVRSLLTDNTRPCLRRRSSYGLFHGPGLIYSLSLREFFMCSEWLPLLVYDGIISIWFRICIDLSARAMTRTTMDVREMLISGATYEQGRSVFWQLFYFI